MFVDFMQDKTRALPDIADPDGVTALRIWNCNYASLAAIARLVNLEELTVFSFPDAGFDMLAGLSRLRRLEVTHLPGVRDLTPLSRLQNLHSLSLATLASWDSSGKVQEVQSLAPVGLLTALRHIELFGVRPPDKSLRPLESCSSLKSARISKYPKAEIARFVGVMGCATSFIPEPRLMPAGSEPVKPAKRSWRLGW